jgi:hypothetical protein
MKTSALVLVIIMILSAAPVMAKEGLFFGAYLLPSVDISGVSVDSGSGYGFRLGLGFGRYFSLEGIYEKTRHDYAGGTAHLDGYAVDARLNFPLTSLDSAKIMSLEPYILLGYGINYKLEGSGISSSGGGVRYGIGVEQYLFRELSVNLGYTRTVVSFDAPINKDGTVRSVELGLIYHFL